MHIHVTQKWQICAYKYMNVYSKDDLLPGFVAFVSRFHHAASKHASLLIEGKCVLAEK